MIVVLHLHYTSLTIRPVKDVQSGVGISNSIVTQVHSYTTPAPHLQQVVTTMSANRVESVERALTILNTFRTAEDSRSLKELAEITGLYKSTILRIAGSLERFGYLVRESDGSYKAGQGLLRFSTSVEQDQDMERVIRPILKALVSQTGETASYYIREENHRVCLFREIGSGELRHFVEEGARLGMGMGAPSKALLASAKEKNKIFISKGERIAGIAGVAVPVIHLDSIHGALTLSGAVERFTDEACANYGSTLQDYAERISQRL